MSTIELLWNFKAKKKGKIERKKKTKQYKTEHTTA